MPTVAIPQDTLFTFDVLGRYSCNTLQEALDSMDKSKHPDSQPFDMIVIGGGSFGAVLASHMYNRDVTRAHRILVLEAGPFVLPEHFQNLPGNFSPPVKGNPGTIWGQPWDSDSPAGWNQGFPGLAYCIGGRSVFWGGWSPYLIDSELDGAWPANVKNDLKNKVLPRTSPAPTESYLDQAARQIGTEATNDFLFGALHTEMRKRLFGLLTGGPALSPDVLTGNRGALGAETDLEAPLAVQSNSPRPGAFGFNKFNGVQLLMSALRAAQTEAAAAGGGNPDNADSVKRLMLANNCYVTRLERNGAQITRVWVKSQGMERPIDVPNGGRIFLALGTIESTRLALNTVPEKNLIGRNLMAHLRSNLTFRVPRAAFGPALDPVLHPETKELQVSALFVKGIHTHPTDSSKGHYHFQITASGVGELGKNAEAELWQKIPNIDDLDQFKNLTDKWVVVTLRGIGEMVGDPTSADPQNRITRGGPDGNGVPKALVRQETNWKDKNDPRVTDKTDPRRTKDNDLWDAMDTAAQNIAAAFANGGPIEYLSLPNNAAAAVWQNGPPSFSNCRDTLSSTHHESGTLWMGDNAATSVTDEWGRIWETDNLYAVGPALLPRMGSPNPMLSGVALARRLGDELVPTPIPPTPAAEPGFNFIFDGTSASFAKWKMAGFGGFSLFEKMLIAQQDGNGIGLLYYTPKKFENFILRLDFLLSHPLGAGNDNSGVFVRFRDPTLPDPAPQPADPANNTAFVAVHTGYEVQIDEESRGDKRFNEGDGAFYNHTGAIYKVTSMGSGAGQQNYNNGQKLAAGQWQRYEIEVNGQTYTVRLNGQQTSRFVRSPADTGRGNPPSVDANSGFLGLQTHTGRVAFANVRVKTV